MQMTAKSVHGPADRVCDHCKEVYVVISGNYCQKWNRQRSGINLCTNSYLHSAMSNSFNIINMPHYKCHSFCVNHVQMKLGLCTKIEAENLQI